MELIDEFLPKSAYEISDELQGEAAGGDILISVNKDGCSDVNTIKRELYKALSDAVGNPTDWGILTGVRPVKLAGELTEKNGREKAAEILKADYLISDEKTKLILDIYEHQMESCGHSDNNRNSPHLLRPRPRPHPSRRILRLLRRPSLPRIRREGNRDSGSPLWDCSIRHRTDRHNHCT